MANQEQVEMLKRSVREWNDWRGENTGVWVDLTKANLKEMNLIEADLRKVRLEGANLTGTNLTGAYLIEADLKGTTLTGADLREANLMGANLSQANLSEAKLYNVDLGEVDLSIANLSGANLKGANLTGADFTGTDLERTDLSGANLYFSSFRGSTLHYTKLTNARLGSTSILESDLSAVIGLETCEHDAPSSIDHHTFQKSGVLPISFLRGVGYADWQIEDIKLLQPGLSNSEINDIIYRVFELRANQAIQISRLFISYSSENDEFVDILESKLIEKGIRFWRDKHDMLAGRIDKQIDRAIGIGNRTLLLVLSKHSVNSHWVEYEVQKAIEKKRETGKDTLCPVSLDDSWKDCNWPGQIKHQVESFHILDFSDWKKSEVFDRQFSKLLQGLDIFYK